MPSLSRRLVFALAVLAAAPAAAQQQPSSGARPVGAVAGTVWDSLAGRALAGARVWIAGTTLETLADGRGRFRFDSVPAGSRSILFEHPGLDSIGLPPFGRRVVVSAGAAAAADLAVPSLASLAQRLCGAPLPPPAGDDEPLGIVFGSVSDAGSRTRLAGARVEASWIVMTFEHGRLLDLGRSARNVRSDSVGNYYVCAVPTQRMIAVAAATAASASGRLDVLVGERRLHRQDILVALDTLDMTLDSLGRLAGRATVIGVVRTEGGSPLAGAQALVDDAGEPVTTDAAGRFVLAGLPAGTHMLTVRAIGYGAYRVPAALVPGDTVRVAPVLDALTVLDTLTVAVPRSALLAETVERLRQGSLGHVLVGEQVRRAPDMAVVLRQLPSLDVRDTGREFTIIARTGARSINELSGATCRAIVWLDGYQSDAEVLRTVRPADVVAVEWYPRGTFVPLRYQPPGLSHCGVMLIWTNALR